MNREIKAMSTAVCVLLITAVFSGTACTSCECGEWEDITVSWTSPSGTPESWTGSCGDIMVPGPIPMVPIPVIIALGTPIMIHTSTICEPSPPCLEPSYEWEVTEVGPGPPFTASGTTLPASFTPIAAGWNTFKIELSASCDGSSCAPCALWMRVNPELPPEPCVDIIKKVVDPNTGQVVDDIEVPVGTEIDFAIKVCNCGTYDLHEIKVVDEFPDCLEYLGSAATVNIDDISISGNQVTWDFSSLTLHPEDCFKMKVEAKVVSQGVNRNCIEVYADSQGGNVSDGDCATVTGGPCLGTILVLFLLCSGLFLVHRKET